MKKESTRKLRKLMFLLLGLLLVLALVPVAHVTALRFWNITWSPMQWQRAMQARRDGEKWHNRPIQWVSLDDTPRKLVHYIWASEDQRFFEHRGFDLAELRKAIARARASNQSVRGASTITMQCARSVCLWQGRSYLRKVLEAYYTFWMETLLDKRRILELYLNHIEFGPGIYGIGAAAQSHFGKPPSKLTNEQMAALAAILPNPLQWSPTRPDATVRAKIRRVQRLTERSRFPDSKLDEK